MPYKDKAKQAKFQNDALKRRRSEWIAAQGGVCSVPGCGSTEKLQVTRIDLASGADAHIWSYSEKKRVIRLKNFTVKCRRCAGDAIKAYLKERATGKQGPDRYLRHSDVWAIRGRLLGKESIRSIARDFGVCHQAVQSIQKGKTWGWLTPGTRKVAFVAAIWAEAPPQDA